MSLGFSEFLRLMAQRPMVQLLPKPLGQMFADATAGSLLDMVASGMHRFASDLGNRYTALGNRYGQSIGVMGSLVDFKALQVSYMMINMLIAATTSSNIDVL